MSQELIVKKYSLDKANRVAGIATVSALTLATIALSVAAWWPVVFLLAPAFFVSYAILVSGIEQNAKATYYRDIVAVRDSEVKRHLERYTSLYEHSRDIFFSKTASFNRSTLAKAVLTGKPATFVFDTKVTDKFGGCIKSGVEVRGFTMKIQEKNHPSDVQMWSEAFENASLLK